MNDAAPLAPAPDRAAIEAARALSRRSQEGRRGPARHGERQVRLPNSATLCRPALAVASREGRALGAEDAMASLVEAMAPDSLTVEIARGYRACRADRDRASGGRRRRLFALFLDRDRARRGRARDGGRDLPRRRAFRSAARGDDGEGSRKGAKLRHAAAIADDAGASSREPARRTGGGGGTERFRLRVGRRADAPADLRQADRRGREDCARRAGADRRDASRRHDARGRPRRAARGRAGNSTARSSPTRRSASSRARSSSRRARRRPTAR